MRRKKRLLRGKSASFKRGHGCFFKREIQDSTKETATCLKYVHLPEDMMNSALSTPSTDHGAQLLRDCEDQVCTDGPKLLRPSPATATLLKKTCKRNNRHSSREVMKLYQPIKVENLWNEAVHEHVEKSRGCPGKLMFDETGEKKVGMCWRERLKCSDCPYVSAHLVKVNQEDMSEICRDIGKINEAKG